MDRNIKKNAVTDTWIFKMCIHYTRTGIHHPCLSNSFVKRPVYLQPHTVLINNNYAQDAPQFAI
ncbi:baculovirus repeated ORF [Choristoneura fumiferana multiple nucleopolyhedrovirus]|uniref:Baculovirus repeated ORF n=1 Tax=Choristoneura fumiferana nuclear polyhedrosis virus TaxID=208973 RepID=Q7TLX6_NPVCF|nr:baculovirus repeated ORF [Choristoneura fumiferana multiple nucleopolyhedrovirus]AAP29800.1 baculovirus repeated ORF [Choristoneura fumiferana multiple nucleopolyhedrovirus]